MYGRPIQKISKLWRLCLKPSRDDDSNIQLNRKDNKGETSKKNTIGIVIAWESVSPSEEKQGKLEQNISSRVTETWMELCSCEILRGTCLVGGGVGGEK
jgi:hypothetical protein